MRTIKGVVTSDKMDKTVVVAVHSYKKHAKYNKQFRITRKFYAHDENNEYKIGDNVLIKEVRPISKLKKWEVVKE